MFGFFAVLIARELPGRTRVWPYLLAGVVTTVLGLRAAVPGRALAERPGRRDAVRHAVAAGAGHRLPPPRRALVLDAAAGLVVLRHVRRRRAVACAAQRPTRLLARFAAATPTTVLDDHGLVAQRTGASCPRSATNAISRRRWPLDLQVAGPLEPLQQRLERTGLARAAAGGLGRDPRACSTTTPPARPAGAAGHARRARRNAADAARRRAATTSSTRCVCGPRRRVLARRHAAVARHHADAALDQAAGRSVALWLPTRRRRPCARALAKAAGQVWRPRTARIRTATLPVLRVRDCRPGSTQRKSAPAGGRAARAGRRSAAAPAAARPAAAAIRPGASRPTRHRRIAPAAPWRVRRRPVRGCRSSSVPSRPCSGRNGSSGSGSHHSTSATSRPLSRTRARCDVEAPRAAHAQGQQAIVAAAEILDHAPRCRTPRALAGAPDFVAVEDQAHAETAAVARCSRAPGRGSGVRTRAAQRRAGHQHGMQREQP